MDTKYLSFNMLGVPASGVTEPCFMSGTGGNVWQDAACAIVAESQGDMGQTRTTRFTGKAGQAAMPSGVPEVACDAQSEALWINEQGQILDCSGRMAELFGYWKDELKGRHISVLLPDLTDSLFAQYSSPTALWIDEEGQILDCSGPVEEIFGYWKNELKGQHISMLLPDLAHTELMDLDGDSMPRITLHSHDAIALDGVKPQGDETATCVILRLTSTKPGCDLSVILRSKVH